MRTKSVINSPRLIELRKRKRKILKAKIIVFFIVFFILFIGFIFISRISTLNIKDVNISGNSIVENRDIKAVIDENISGNYLWVFPKTNFLFYPKHKLKKELQEKFKRLKEISINLKNTRTLNISVSEYGGKYLWCGENIPVLENNVEENKCYFLDDNGYIFDEAPYFSGEVYFKFYGSIENGNNISVGKVFLPNNFKNIISFKENLKKINLNPTAFWLDENKEDGNISLSGEPNISPKIIFKIDSDFQKNAENLETAITAEPLKTNLETKLSSLIYLDLRFNNKVYYKFK